MIQPASNLPSKQVSTFSGKIRRLEVFCHGRPSDKCPHYYEGIIFWSQPHTGLLRLCSALSTYLATLQTARVISKLPCSSSPSLWNEEGLSSEHGCASPKALVKTHLQCSQLASCLSPPACLLRLAPGAKAGPGDTAGPRGHGWQSHPQAPCPPQLTRKGQRCPGPDHCKKSELLTSYKSGNGERRWRTQHDLSAPLTNKNVLQQSPRRCFLGLNL